MTEFVLMYFRYSMDVITWLRATHLRLVVVGLHLVEVLGLSHCGYQRPFIDRTQRIRDI